MFTRKLAPILLLGAVLTLSACGSGSPSSPSVAALGNSTSSPASAGSGDNGKSEYQQAVAFSACMRSHGMPDFPDPKQSANGGGITLSIGGKASANSSVFQKAQQACQSLMPKLGGLGKTPGHLDPAKISAWMKCLRSHGLPNLPDPQNNGNMLMFNLPQGSGGLSPGSTSFQNAMQACKSLNPGGGIAISAGKPSS
jgi:hypothetical protein